MTSRAYTQPRRIDTLEQRLRYMLLIRTIDPNSINYIHTNAWHAFACEQVWLLEIHTYILALTKI